MPKHHFSHVETWIFDLDNTLYPPAARLFDQIEVKMTDWVARVLSVDQAEADRVRKDYWHRYGTTLAGLMREHDVDPAPYLNEVHDISLDHLAPAPDLAEAITALPGRCIVYTNGCEPYARRVLSARGIEQCFEAVYGVEHAGFVPKPERAAFEAIAGIDGFDHNASAMFEDDIRNLEAPFALGMRTVHVAPQTDARPFVHHHTDDLTGFLQTLT
ncbi:MAG: pyrimidine 5'-nucleotidase [Silicimonas sp.]|nr:pyrimidine 5'-nucleotidase [Silicimonas sp.]